jgi:hypothetical protein
MTETKPVTWNFCSNGLFYAASKLKFISLINRSNPLGGMFDKQTFRCVGMNASVAGKSAEPRISSRACRDRRSEIIARFAERLTTADTMVAAGGG